MNQNKDTLVSPRRYVVTTWRDYDALASRIIGRFDGEYQLRYFDYLHPTRLQRSTPYHKKPYTVRVAYTDWGDPKNPTLICCGGVANPAVRFNYLASDLKRHFRIVSVDWLGRGLSGWMSYEPHYSFETYVEQIKQLIAHLNVGPVTILGSSQGGRVAMDLAAKHPQLVNRLILNDTGPHHPRKRHVRRSQVVSRFYVFRDPADLLRRVGASQKNDGPIGDDVRFYITYHLTKWSNENGGRIYRHDMRAMQAYAIDDHLEQWREWAKLRCPTLVMHGLLSDVLLPETVARMQRSRPITVVHIPDTGHTPVLSDRNQTHFIRNWLLEERPAPRELTLSYAQLREKWMDARAVKGTN